ncbi:hypothetical protein ACFE04_010053 [Oxalis oulophora]
MVEENNKHNMQQQQQQREEAEEALSLCDLPIANSNDNNNHNHEFHRPSSSDLFEFLTTLTSDITPADDIIFCGKLLPLKDKFPKQQLVKDVKPPKLSTSTTFRPRKSEFVTDIKFTNAQSVTRTSRSRSLDYLKRETFQSDSLSLDNNSSARSFPSKLDKSDSLPLNINSSIKSRKTRAMKPPRWYFLIFGIAKIPKEMELSDIKNRQIRRSSSSVITPADEPNKKLPVNRIIKALSCRDVSSVSATTPFYIPQASR